MEMEGFWWSKRLMETDEPVGSGVGGDIRERF